MVYAPEKPTEAVISIKGLNNNGIPKPYESKMLFMVRPHDIFDILREMLNAPKRVVACAAELIQYFKNWTKWKQENQRTSWIYKPLQEIEADLRAYSSRTIRWAIELLMGVKILERRNDPGHKLNRTYQYKLNLDYLKAPESPAKSAETRVVVDLTNCNNAFDQEQNASDHQQNAFASGDQIKQNNSIKNSTKIEVTADSAVVDEKFEDLLDREKKPYQSNFVNPAEVKVNVSNLIEEEEEESIQEEPNPGEDEYSPAPRDVNQAETALDVNDGKTVSNDVLGEVEKLVGEEYSPQLERLVLGTQIEVVKNAIAFVKEKLATKGTEIKRKAGYLTNAIRNKLEPSSSVQQSRSSSQEQKYPPGFLEWYKQASEAGWVDGREPRHLSWINGGEPLVFVPSQRRSMIWRDAQALFDSCEQADTKPKAETEQSPSPQIKRVEKSKVQKPLDMGTIISEVYKTEERKVKNNVVTSPTPSHNNSRRFRYIGGLKQNFVDSEGNAITLTPEMLLEEISQAVNPDYANVRPEGTDYLPLGILRINLQLIE